MKMYSAILLATVSLSASVLAAPPAETPLLGSWAVDVSQLPVPPQARPKSVTITFREAQNGALTTNVDIVAPDGSENRSTANVDLEGKVMPVTNSIEADVVAGKMPAPNVLVLVLSKGGVPGSTRIYTVSNDGDAMVETATYFGADGQPLMRTNYFKRVE